MRVKFTLRDRWTAHGEQVRLVNSVPLIIDLRVGVARRKSMRQAARMQIGLEGSAECTKGHIIQVIRKIP